MVRKIDHRFSCVHVTSFPLISLTNRFFLCWEHSVPGMKTVELPPPPPPPSHFLLPIFTPSRRFHPQLTTNNSNLQGNREKLINFKSKWNYVRISKTKAPPPTSPPTLCKSSNPAKISQSKVDTNQVFLFFTVKIFTNSHFSAPFFNKIKLEMKNCVKGSANLFFSFFQQKRKKDILLILIIFTYFKVLEKIEKRKLSGKSIIFSFF